MAERHAVPLSVYRIGAAGLDDGGRFAAAYGVTDTGAVLMRPDGHVAWRAAAAPGHAGELAGALAQLLRL